MSHEAANRELTYQVNGYVTLAGASVAVRTLVDYLRVGDFSSIEAEFARAIGQLERDPHSAITAASSIIEALCKTYIETFKLEPSKCAGYRPIVAGCVVSFGPEH